MGEGADAGGENFGGDDEGGGVGAEVEEELGGEMLEDGGRGGRGGFGGYLGDGETDDFSAGA